MEFKDLIEDFSRRMGGAVSLDPAEPGVLTLAVDDMPLSILHLAELDQVALLGEVGEPPPAEHTERLYRAMLAANHLFAGTGGATLSFDTATGKIMLCRVLPLLTVDGASFADLVEGFVNTLESWRHLVSEFRGAVENGESDERSDAPHVFGSGFMQV